MNSHLRKDMEKLKQRILKVATASEEILETSLRALKELSLPLAAKVIDADRNVDLMEIDAEEECMKILALHQPVAGDLRFVVTVLKINSELEHIADIAVNIAKRVSYIGAARADIPFNLDMMTGHVLEMMKNSVDAFLRSDEYLAIQVCKADEFIDAENRKAYANVAKASAENPRFAMTHMNYLLVSRSIERIADLCTNIAEDVIYMKRSIIVRHNLQKSIEEIEAKRMNAP